MAAGALEVDIRFFFFLFSSNSFCSLCSQPFYNSCFFVVALGFWAFLGLFVICDFDTRMDSGGWVVLFESSMLGRT